LQGRVVDVERDGFLTTMEVSCWSFIRMAHLAEPLMKNGGGSQMAVKNYNIMGVAKAALDSAVRYMAAELGPQGTRATLIRSIDSRFCAHRYSNRNERRVLCLVEVRACRTRTSQVEVSAFAPF
jgi:enoyl-[acyl-carrier-protein] reductase (NADH)